MVQPSSLAPSSVTRFGTVNDQPEGGEESARNVDVHVTLQQGQRGNAIRALLQEYDGSERIIAAAGSTLLLLAEAIDHAITSSQGKRGETRIVLEISSRNGDVPSFHIGWFSNAECKRMDAES
jgi:hypothetical protein